MANMFWYAMSHCECSVLYHLMSVHACVVQSMSCCEPTASVCAAANSTCRSRGLRCSRGGYITPKKYTFSTLLVKFNYELKNNYDFHVPFLQLCYIISTTYAMQS